MDDMLMVRDTTTSEALAMPLADVRAAGDRYLMIVFDADTGEPSEVPLAEAVAGLFRYAKTHLRPGEPARAVAEQQAIDLAGDSYGPRQFRKQRKGGRNA